MTRRTITITAAKTCSREVVVVEEEEEKGFCAAAVCSIQEPGSGLTPPQPTPPHLTLPPLISDIALIVYLSPHWSADYGGLFVDFGVEGAKAGGSVTVPR